MAHKRNRLQHPFLRYAGVTFTDGAKQGTDSKAEERRMLSWQKKIIGPGGKCELLASLAEIHLGFCKGIPFSRQDLSA